MEECVRCSLSTSTQCAPTGRGGWWRRMDARYCMLRSVAGQVTTRWFLKCEKGQLKLDDRIRALFVIPATANTRVANPCTGFPHRVVNVAQEFLRQTEVSPRAVFWPHSIASFKGNVVRSFRLGLSAIGPIIIQTYWEILSVIPPQSL